MSQPVGVEVEKVVGCVHGLPVRGSGPSGRIGSPGISKAMDGRREAHKDVLVAVPGEPILPDGRAPIEGSST